MAKENTGFDWGKFADISQALGPVAGGVFGAVGQLFRDRSPERWAKENRGVARRARKELEEGISTQDVLTMNALNMRSLQPLLRRMSTANAAKYGSRSAATVGANVAGASQAIAPHIAAGWMEKLRNNQQNQRLLYNVSSASALPT